MFDEVKRMRASGAVLLYTAFASSTAACTMRPQHALPEPTDHSNDAVVSTSSARCWVAHPVLVR